MNKNARKGSTLESFFAEKGELKALRRLTKQKVKADIIKGTFSAADFRRREEARDKFIGQALRAAERSQHLPAGWWGDWRNVFANPDIEIRFTSSLWWNLKKAGKVVSRHESREAAIRAAKKIYDGKSSR